MAGKIPQSFLADLLAQTNIVTLIQNRLALKKSGDNYHCKCPFHQENSPSFSVSEKKQFFYCFGCGEHGNAIQFLMRYDRLAFRSAVETLAAQAGMTVPSSTEHNSHQADFSVMQDCLTQYHQQLQHPHAQQYLNQRDIPENIAEHYQIGYAPPGWEFINRRLQGQHTQTLITLGMLIPSQKDPQRHYDRFRERIMFPIRNERGQVLAFGGRSITQQNPKYLNSPETPIFHKRQALYGLYEAKQHSAATLSSLIVVEGYMDVIAMATHGIKHVVATLGTAITPEHITQLFKHTQQLVFCFDGDLAGQKAAWKACELCLTLMHDGRQVSFLCLPGKEDPDSFLRSQGAAAMRDLLPTATPISDFFFSECGNRFNTEQLAGRAAFAKEAQQTISQCPEGIFKSLMYQQLSKLVALPVEHLRAATKDTNSATKSAAKIPLSTTANSRHKRGGVTSAIQKAIALLLQYPEAGKGLTLQPFTISTTVPPGEGWVLVETLVACINQHTSHISTGTLLNHFTDHPRIAWMANQAAIEPITPAEGAKDEIIAALAQHHRQGVTRTIAQLIEKSKTSSGLSQEEKIQLKSLIKAKSGAKSLKTDT